MIIYKQYSCFDLMKFILLNFMVLIILGDSLNYMPSIQRIPTRILVIAKLSGRKYFILRGFYDIIRPSKEIPVQS